jgi:hypothetical protein
MKIFFLYLFIAVVMFFCSCQRHSKPETDFFRDFSLGKIVEKMNVPELKPLSGGGGTATSNEEEATARRSDFYLEYRIQEPEGERFDEERFLTGLRLEIENKIAESQIRTKGTGISGNSFNYDYSKDNNKGWLEIVGARLEGNKYMLWCVLREEAGAENTD